MHRASAAARLAARRAELADLETALTAACERAAGRGGPSRFADPTTWSPAIWRRYLREALDQDFRLGPRMRRLAAEIGRLEQRDASRPCHSPGGSR